jgi:hypothetical protein
MDRGGLQVWDDFAYLLERPEEKCPKSIANKVQPSSEYPNCGATDVHPVVMRSLEEVAIFRYQGNLKTLVNYDFN